MFALSVKKIPFSQIKPFFIIIHVRRTMNINNCLWHFQPYIVSKIFSKYFLYLLTHKSRKKVINYVEKSIIHCEKYGWCSHEGCRSKFWDKLCSFLVYIPSNCGIEMIFHHVWIYSYFTCFQTVLTIVLIQTLRN